MDIYATTDGYDVSIGVSDKYPSTEDFERLVRKYERLERRATAKKLEEEPEGRKERVAQMILLVVIAILAASIVMTAIGDREDYFGLEILGLIFGATASIALVVMVVFVFLNRAGAEATRAANEQRYEALVYKVESDAYRDELGLLNKSVIDEVQEWNEDLAERKELSQNPWVGIFYPNIYEDFEYINYADF